MQTSELARIVDELSVEPEEGLTPQQVVDQAAAIVPGCDMCSLFVRKNETVELAACTDPVAREIDDVQFDLGEGPCLTVLGEHEFVFVRDVGADSRWPRWSEAAVAAGVASSLSVHLGSAETRIACLNMYSRAPDGFDEDATDRALVYARLAALALVQAREVSGLRSALHSRMVIGAAQGVLMERYGLSLERAFEVLRRHSNESNTKLRDVAHSVLDSAGRSAG